MLSDKERGRLKPSDKQIIGSRKLARAQSIQDYFLDERQSSADYIKVLENHLLPFGEAYYGKFYL